MQIPVLVEPLSDGQFRAQAPPPFGLTAEGASSDEAIEKLKNQMTQSVSTGKRLVAVEVPVELEHPWMPYVGQFADDPLYDSWQEAIAEFRRQRAADDEE